MRLRFCFFALSIFIHVVIAPSTQAADQRAAPLHIGDTFPAFSGQTFTGNRVTFPAPANNQPTVMVFSFSRAAAADARRWNQHLSEDFSGKVPVYGVILLEDAPRLFRPMAVDGIKRSMPYSVQDRTILSYRREELWKRRLHVSDSSHAIVVVLGPQGHVRWINSSKFTATEYAHLKDKISPLFSSQR